MLSYTIKDKEMLERLLLKIAKGLDNQRIPYMVIGGQAALAYGLTRLTEDIDITLGVDVEMLPVLLKFCKSVRLKRISEADDEFVKKTNVLLCLDSTTGIRIDFIFSFLAYERQAIKLAHRVNIKGYSIKFASAEDLIIHKLCAGRARDLEDVKNLILKLKDKLDIHYIKKWLKEFSKIPEFKGILREFQQVGQT